MSRLPELIQDIRGIKTEEDDEAVSEKYAKEFDTILGSVTNDQWNDVRDLITACVQCGAEKTLQFLQTVFTKRKLIEWKKHPEVFDTFFDTLLEIGRKPATAVMSSYDLKSVLEKAITFLKSFQILSKYSERFYDIITVAINNRKGPLAELVTMSGEQVPWPKHVDKMTTVMETTRDVIKDKPAIPYDDKYGCMLADLWYQIFQTLWPAGKKNKQAAVAIVGVVSEVFAYCADAEWEDPKNREKESINYTLCKYILDAYIQWHPEQRDLVKPLGPTLLQLRKCDDAEMAELAQTVCSMLGDTMADVMGDNMDELIDEFIEDPSCCSTDINRLGQAFKTNPDVFKHRMNDIANAVFDCGDFQIIKDGLYLVLDMSKKYPMEFTTEVIGKIVETLPLEDTHGYGLLCLDAMVTARTEDIAPHDDIIINCIKKLNQGSQTALEILIRLSTLGEDYAAKYTSAIVNVARTCGNKDYVKNLLWRLTDLGAKYPHILAKHMDFIEECMGDPSLASFAKHAQDIANKRTLHDISGKITEHKEDIQQVDERVKDTAQRVDGAHDQAQKLDEQVLEVKADVSEQGERLNELEEVVEETVEKVEEVDKKTLSHAPVWSRDVAKLMNPEAEHDWRFLATRLGYSKDDIRNWATQPDPCLSLLDEWFATHKTRDATFAVEQALNEMNRVDAAMIVENALKQTEGVVEEDDTETWDPPPIFISYQWGHQQEVKLLHKHLEMAGYKSWMDIGQMGGGDKLFAKIDQGIRAAKVVICCVSEKYAKSANCNREVNLSVTLGKPMIPLLMEKLSWPPPGSMGPIFGEYIFVRFFARPGETAGDDRYWPTAKFQELLMQIRFTHAPDPSLIASNLYRDWWDPPEEIIVVKPKENKAQSVTRREESDENEHESPEVFISYQWGKQPQIKKLYSTLTSRGYVCWLDIMQMGGGDSLYDKIDKGIRGCKVVVSCVTSKYALSANCRREVSLADALKKPIVPLLLEKTTWPPAGPMSMVFTQLLYIDFCQPSVEVQNSWTCPQMNDLYGKLANHVTRMKSIENDTNKTTDSQPSKNNNFETKQDRTSVKTSEKNPAIIGSSPACKASDESLNTAAQRSPPEQTIPKESPKKSSATCCLV